MRLKLTSPFTKRNLISQDCIPDQILMTKVKYNLYLQVGCSTQG